MTRRRLRAVWESITEPRHLKVTYLVLYAITVLTGITTLLVPPTSIAGALGQPLAIAWAVFWIMGGFGGALTVLPGWWWAERLSIVLIWAGMGIYAIVVISLHFMGTGSRLTQLGMLTLASAVFLVRWFLIRRYSFEPRPGEQR